MFIESGYQLAYRRNIEINPRNDERIVRGGWPSIFGSAPQQKSAEQASRDEPRRQEKPNRSYQWIDLLGLVGRKTLH